MYHIYWENRRAKANRIVYSYEFAQTKEEMGQIIEEMMKWERKYRPDIINVYNESGKVNYTEELGR